MNTQHLVSLGYCIPIAFDELHFCSCSSLHFAYWSDPRFLVIFLEFELIEEWKQLNV